MGYNGERTNIWQRQVNARNSRATLAALLAANFGAGAYLLTLTYQAGALVPSDRLAGLQISDWLRAARRASCPPLRYVRATRKDAAGRYPIHRIVTTQSEATVDALAGLWQYGPVVVEPAPMDDIAALVDDLVGPSVRNEQRAVPFRRSWIASVGLIRS